MSKTKWYHKPIYALVALALVLSLGIMAMPMARTVEASPGALDMSNWADYAENPVFGQGVDSGPKAYYPTVVYDGTKYLMLYDQPASYATSEDGIRWTSGGEVTGLTNARHMVMLYDANGFSGGSYKYKIWYFDKGASVTNGVDSIRYAESNNGITWVNDQAVFGGNMVTSGDDNVDAPSRTWGPGNVLYDPEATNTGNNPLDYSYVMYYDGCNGITDDPTWDNTEALFLAYSKDGINWNRYTINPVLKGGSPGEWDNGGVGYPTVMGLGNGSYIMWYSGGGGCNQGIGFATSPDGIQWTKGESNPIFHVSDTTNPSGYRAERTYTPRVIDDGSGVLKMYYSAKSNIGLYAIGLALPAHPSQVWVDDEWTSQGNVYLSDTSLIWQYNAFATIQEGINAVAEGGAVNVAAGTYAEQVVIDKQLTLNGANAVTEARGSESIIDGGTSTAITISADDVIVDGFTLDGGTTLDDRANSISGGTISNNIITGASSSEEPIKAQNGIRVGFDTGKGVDGVTIEDNTISNSLEKGIRFANPKLGGGTASNITISGNEIKDNGSAGIETYGPGHNTIINNSISGNSGNGINLKFDDGDVVTSNTITNNSGPGITLRRVTNTTVENNSVSGHKSQEVIGTCPAVLGGKGSGIHIFDTSENNTICFNDISGNNYGIFIHSKGVLQPSDNSINFNNIYGNTGYGILNALIASPAPVDATNNWWGHASGPSGDNGRVSNKGKVIGKGDTVSANVDWDPWLPQPVGYTKHDPVPPGLR